MEDRRERRAARLKLLRSDRCLRSAGPPTPPVLTTPPANGKLSPPKRILEPTRRSSRLLDRECYKTENGSKVEASAPISSPSRESESQSLEGHNQLQKSEPGEPSGDSKDQMTPFCARNDHCQANREKLRKVEILLDEVSTQLSQCKTDSMGMEAEVGTSQEHKPPSPIGDEMDRMLQRIECLGQQLSQVEKNASSSQRVIIVSARRKLGVATEKLEQLYGQEECPHKSGDGCKNEPEAPSQPAAKDEENGNQESCKFLVAYWKLARYLYRFGFV